MAALVNLRAGELEGHCGGWEGTGSESIVRQAEVLMVWAPSCVCAHHHQASSPTAAFHALRTIQAPTVTRATPSPCTTCTPPVH